MSVFLLTAILCELVFLKLSLAADTLSANQTISNGQTLISQNRYFELGFFSRGTSGNRFLGIWYRNTPDVVVWIANRNNPITDGEGVVLEIARNGKLVISRDGSTIWSLSSSGVASNLILHLLDNGNLILADKTIESYSSKNSYIWQSFDYPCDTRLPGMWMVHSPDTSLDKYLTSWRSYHDPSPGDFSYRIENKGLPQMVIFRGTKKIYRSGMWNGVYINVPTFYNNVYKGQLVIDRDRTSYFDPYNSSILTRLTIDQSGMLHRYTMDKRKDKWNLVYTIPKDPCDDYAKCGPNGICRIERVPICDCLMGFTPKFQTDWDFQDWSGGCTRMRALNCQNGDGFLELKGVKYPDMSRFWLNTSMSIGECKDECLGRCNCTAYAQPYINNGGSGCLMWVGDLIDTRVLPGADKNQNIYIRLPVSELESPTDSENKKKRKRPGKLIPISVVSGVLISVLIGGVIVVMTRRKRQGNSLTFIVAFMIIRRVENIGSSLSTAVLNLK